VLKSISEIRNSREYTYFKSTIDEDCLIIDIKLEVISSDTSFEF